MTEPVLDSTAFRLVHRAIKESRLGHTPKIIEFLDPVVFFDSLALSIREGVGLLDSQPLPKN